MKLSDLLLNRFLKRDYTDPSTLDAEIQSLNEKVVDTSISSGNAATDVNTGSIPLNSSKLSGPIPQNLLDISDLGWTQTCAFSVTDADTVSWGVGSFVSAAGTTYAIAAGNTGNMTAKTYIYLDLNISTTAYQVSTSITDPIGTGKVLIAVAQNGGTAATYVLVQATQIVGDNIIANTISGNKITAGSITATQISSSYIYAGSISADQINTGTLTGIIIQTGSSGQRVVLYSTLASYYDDNGLLICSTYANGKTFWLKGERSDSSLYLGAGANGEIAFIAGTTVKIIYDIAGNSFYPTTTNTIDLGGYGYRWNGIYCSSVDTGSITLGGFDTITSWADVGSYITYPPPSSSDISSILHTDLGGLNGVTLNVRRVTTGGVDSGWYALTFNYGLLTGATVH